MFLKIVVLKNFANFTGKHQCWSLSLQACNFVKKRLQHRCYVVKFAKFLITIFFTEQLFTVTASVCSENLVKILVRRNKIFPCRCSRGNYLKRVKQYPQLFLLLSWAPWNFELNYICAALWIINNAVILSFQNLIF